MALKAVLFDFNGVIINDEPIHERLTEQILLEENLRPQPGEYSKFCLGKSDRLCLRELFELRGRYLSEADLDRLVSRKANLYQAKLQQLETLPIFPGLADLIYRLRVTNLTLAIVSGAQRWEIETVLERSGLRDYFATIVAGDDISTSKPDPTGYLRAISQLNAIDPTLELTPADCLAIEDTFAGIQAAKRAGISVVGVANTYPFHMLQRQANWVVDYLNDLELERVQEVLASKEAG